MTDLRELPPDYRVILCDIWGCVHDGVAVFPEAESLLRHWRDEGRVVILLTNAPRPASAVQAQLDRLGLDRNSYDAIVTSGDTGLAALRVAGVEAAGFIGTAGDRSVIEATGLSLVDVGAQTDIVCTGLPEGSCDPADQDPILRQMLVRGARLHCMNPDRIVHRGGIAEPCAGAIADRYVAMDGEVSWYGKPHAPIYARALAVASDMLGLPVDDGEVVAVGDSLATDFLGAANAGFAFIFVSHGIEGAEIEARGLAEVIGDFNAAADTHLPPPLAVAKRLGARLQRVES